MIRYLQMVALQQDGEALSHVASIALAAGSSRDTPRLEHPPKSLLQTILTNAAHQTAIVPSIPLAHHASRSLRYQAVHRDLPEKGCQVFALQARITLLPRNTWLTTLIPSWPHQAQLPQPDQIQSPMFAISVHASPERLGEGG